MSWCASQETERKFSCVPHLEIRPHFHVVYEGVSQGEQRLQQRSARALVAVVADHLVAKKAGRVGAEGQPAGVYLNPIGEGGVTE